MTDLVSQHSTMQQGQPKHAKRLANGSSAIKDSAWVNDSRWLSKGTGHKDLIGDPAQDPHCCASEAVEDHTVEVSVRS